MGECMPPAKTHADGRLHARSISRSVWERLQGRCQVGRVLGISRRSCILLFPPDCIVAVVLPELGNGPLNLVVEGTAGHLAMIQREQSVRLEKWGPQIGPLEICLEAAEHWEPRPDWRRLRAQRDAVAGRLDQVGVIAQSHAPTSSFLELISSRFATEPTLGDAYVNAAQEAARSLGLGWQGDTTQLQRAAAQLAGLGGGLTPAGDDFLSGVMLWAWLGHPSPSRFCGMMLAEAAPRTGPLSAAFLRAAAAGECSAAWHRLLAALEESTDRQLCSAVGDVVSYGHTSGADALAGFLWMGMRDAETSSKFQSGRSGAGSLAV
jgi:hypothetical protein